MERALRKRCVHFHGASALRKTLPRNRSFSSHMVAFLKAECIVPLSFCVAEWAKKELQSARVNMRLSSNGEWSTCCMRPVLVLGLPWPLPPAPPPEKFVGGERRGTVEESCLYNQVQRLWRSGFQGHWGHRGGPYPRGEQSGCPQSHTDVKTSVRKQGQL